jgi:hypothetical protein
MVNGTLLGNLQCCCWTSPNKVLSCPVITTATICIFLVTETCQLTWNRVKKVRRNTTEFSTEEVSRETGQSSSARQVSSFQNITTKSMQVFWNVMPCSFVDSSTKLHSVNFRNFLVLHKFHYYSLKSSLFPSGLHTKSCMHFSPITYVLHALPTS